MSARWALRSRVRLVPVDRDDDRSTLGGALDVRCVIERLEVLTENRPGSWEERRNAGLRLTAFPWCEDRYG